MSNVDINSVKPANSVDARGCACPGPLLEAKKGIGKVKVGEVLEILSNDSGLEPICRSGPQKSVTNTWGTSVWMATTSSSS